MTKIISIVSGKGGCGKSLITAILGRSLAAEGERVLLVDLDIFVRGLTVLLYGLKKKNNPKNGVTVADLFGIYDYNSNIKPPREILDSNLSIERFFECDILPSVSNISDPLDYDDKDLSNQEFCFNQLSKLLNSVGDKYDYILLDNRAGMDSFVLSSCIFSDFVITIYEDDDVGRQTNINLVNYLRFNKKIKRIYSIINKARKIKDYESLKQRKELTSDYNTIGVIPFDIEILESFGTEKFWFLINETLYFKALIDTWNRLSTNENVTTITESNYRFPPKIFMNKKSGRYSLFERMLRIYSILFLFIGMGVYLFQKIRYEMINDFELVAIISFVFGIFTLVLSTSNFRNYLLGKKEENHK